MRVTTKVLVGWYRVTSERPPEFVYGRSKPIGYGWEPAYVLR